MLTVCKAQRAAAWTLRASPAQLWVLELLPHVEIAPDVHTCGVPGTLETPHAGPQAARALRPGCVALVLGIS